MSFPSQRLAIVMVTVLNRLAAVLTALVVLRVSSGSVGLAHIDTSGVSWARRAVWAPSIGVSSCRW